MLVSIPLLPFAGFLINALVGRRLSKTISGGLACLVMLASFGSSTAAVVSLLRLPADSRVMRQTVYTWIVSGEFRAPFELLVDPLAAVMILIVTVIGFLIHVYSTAYMHEETDAEYARYFSYLNLFAACMLLLVLAPNLLVMFVGWEGVGLCSYLLIGFWFQKKSAADAGKKAFIVNRIGDFGFVLGVLLTWVTFETVDFQALARAIGPLPVEPTFGTLSIIAMLLFIGATGKSAQIPLHVWLPDAMEGPTPVSALIHAATMVTAGVYLIGRNAVLFGHAPQVLSIVAIVGAATALMAATIGLVQNDIKRVLAYSTVSQLGYMFLAMGAGAFAAGIFHLYTHAFFKALLFLGSGAVIHALAGEQDLHRMGGLRRDLPVTYWTFVVGTLAIAGVPGLAGFFSKDEVLFRTYTSGHRLLWAIGILTSFLTATYMFRLVFLAFHGEASAPHPTHADQRKDAPPAMAIPLILLAVGSIVAGYLGLPHALGGANRIEAFLRPSFTAPAGAEASGEPSARAADIAQEGAAGADVGLERTLMAVSTVVAVAGIAAAAFFFLHRRDRADALAARWSGIHTLLGNKYYVDELYDAAIVEPIQTGSERMLWRGIDAGFIDGAVNGVGTIVSGGADALRRLQTGSVRAYALSVVLGVVLVLGYYLWR
ncbi:MAG: NADH-quinone oxidoreductase subunit L [Acidobacteria bacterium]|nr:NADH-quinone oxidoreductase subunit L [Acidobacteriota bacterium]